MIKEKYDLLGEYKHYNEKVYLLETEYDFKNMLIQQDIRYQILPILLENEIISFYYKKQKMYAVLEYRSGIEEYWQNIYITMSIPDDLDWDLLSDDVYAQYAKKQKPTLMKTKLYKMLEFAEEEIVKQHEEEHPEDFLPYEPSADEMALFLLVPMKHNKERVKSMEHYDIEQTFYDELMSSKMW